MGKRGRIPKQKDKLTGHRDNSLSVIQGGKGFETPKANSRWLTKTRNYWKQYWDSELASTAQQVDFPAFYRLFQYYDEVERANRTIQNLGPVDHVRTQTCTVGSWFKNMPFLINGHG